MAFIRPYPPVIYGDKKNDKIKTRVQKGRYFVCEYVTDSLDDALRFKDEVSKTGANTFRLKKMRRSPWGLVAWYYIFVHRGLESTFEPKSQDNITS